MLAPPANRLGTRDGLVRARWLTLLIPAVLLAGAYGSEIWGGLVPCEMCWWQRYAHFAALGLAVLGFALARSILARPLVILAALAMGVSGAIGAYHAGVEAGVFQGFTSCTAMAGGSLADILATPLVRCDQVQWRFLGLSMAAWNAIISLGGAAAALWLAGRRGR